MMDVPPHLLQPLCIDTNITYELDMSKFPGLDDPQHMYQPALLIATDWSDYHEAQLVTHDADVPEDDLYSLIESSQVLFPEFTDSSSDENANFEALLDEVISSTASCGNLWDESDFTLSDLKSSTDCCYQSELSPLGGRGQKRRHSSDTDHLYTSKKYRMTEVDTHTAMLPSLVSVYPTSNNCIFGRDS
ncbi:uncharacterized protein LOC124146629 [Haliotis rufescens]|uniref:uncharacterized protein LOC124146629 n=1 Tax=Haliotis rufescens TaxID=6454 RepID=UPI00201F2368|nr:uncharacterized protein LOC124146629 [Haliotis rufescens]